MEVAFEISDLDKNGFITREEFVVIVNSLYKVLDESGLKTDLQSVERVRAGDDVLAD